MTNNESRKENDREEIGVERLLSPKEVAEILRISAKTVNKLVRDRKLGCVQVTGKERRFTEEQVTAYIEAKSKRPKEARVDTPRVRQVSSQQPKGGEKSLEFSRRSLREEMRQWQ